MPYKVVIIFTLQPGKADEEISRCRSEQSLLNLLRKQLGFIAYEVVKLDEERTLVSQTWETKEHLAQAMPIANTARSTVAISQENIVLAREVYAGEIALTSESEAILYAIS